MTLERLEGMSIEEHDLLISDNFSSPLLLEPPTDKSSDSATLQSQSMKLLSEQEESSNTVDDENALQSSQQELDNEEVIPSSTVECEDTTQKMEISSEVEEIKTTSEIDESFASALENSLDDNREDVSQSPNYDILATHRLPQRQKEKALTTSQTLQAVAVLCEKELVQEAWPMIIESVGFTGDKKYVQYFWDLARRDFELESKEDTSIWDSYIHSLGSCRDVLQAYNTVESMKSKGITPSLNTWNNLMRCYSYAGDSESALKVGENIRMYANLSPDHTTFLYTIRAHGSNHSVDRETAVRRAINSMYEMTEVYRLEPMRAHFMSVLLPMVYLTSESEWYIKFMETANQMKHVGMNYYYYLVSISLI